VRILKVLALLLALGAGAGAVMGVLVLTATAILTPVDGLRLPDLELVGWATAFGAVVGAVTGPPIALIFLRRVPLWRATIETAAAAGLGAVLGISFPFGWVYCGLSSAVLAALRLRYVYRLRASETTSPDDTPAVV
jgi:hypothetical protein